MFSCKRSQCSVSNKWPSAATAAVGCVCVPTLHSSPPRSALRVHRARLVIINHLKCTSNNTPASCRCGAAVELQLYLFLARFAAFSARPLCHRITILFHRRRRRYAYVILIDGTSLKLCNTNSRKKTTSCWKIDGIKKIKLMFIGLPM